MNGMTIAKNLIMKAYSRVGEPKLQIHSDTAYDIRF